MDLSVLKIIIILLTIRATFGIPIGPCVDINLLPEIRSRTSILTPDFTNATLAILDPFPHDNSKEIGYLRTTDEKVDFKLYKSAPMFNCTRGTLCTMKVFHQSLDGKSETNYIYEKELQGVLMYEGPVVLKVDVPISKDNETIVKYLRGNISSLPLPNHYFQLSMATPDCEDFLFTSKGIVKFLEKLAYALDVPETGIILHDIKCCEDVTRIYFSNNMIDTLNCNKGEIRQFAEKMMKHEEEMQKSFLEKMKPFSNIRNVSFFFAGWCGAVDPTVIFLLSSALFTGAAIVLYSIFRLFYTWNRL